MDEKYIEDLYNQLGGKDEFGSYENFSNLISSDDSYIKDFHNAFGEQTLGSFDSFSKLVKKKDEPVSTPQPEQIPSFLESFGTSVVDEPASTSQEEVTESVTPTEQEEVGSLESSAPNGDVFAYETEFQKEARKNLSPEEYDKFNKELAERNKNFSVSSESSLSPMTKIIEKEAIEEEEFIIEDSQIINNQKNIDLLNSVGYFRNYDKPPLAQIMRGAQLSERTEDMSYYIQDRETGEYGYQKPEDIDGEVLDAIVYYEKSNSDSKLYKEGDSFKSIARQGVELTQEDILNPKNTNPIILSKLGIDETDYLKWEKENVRAEGFGFDYFKTLTSDDQEKKDFFAQERQYEKIQSYQANLLNEITSDLERNQSRQKTSTDKNKIIQLKKEEKELRRDFNSIAKSLTKTIDLFPVFKENTKTIDEIRRRKLLNAVRKGGGAELGAGTLELLSAAGTGIVSFAMNTVAGIPGLIDQELVKAGFEDKGVLAGLSEMLSDTGEIPDIVLGPTKRSGWQQGKPVLYKGTEYIVDSNGGVYDKESNIWMDGLISDEEYRAIQERSSSVTNDVVNWTGGSVATAGVTTLVNLFGLIRAGGKAKNALGLKGKRAGNVGMGIASFTSSVVGNVDDIRSQLMATGMSEKDAMDIAITSGRQIASLDGILSGIAGSNEKLLPGFQSIKKQIINLATTKGKDYTKKQLKDKVVDIVKEMGQELFIEEYPVLLGEKYINYLVNKQLGQDVLNTEITRAEIIEVGVLTLGATGALGSTKFLSKENRNDLVRTIAKDVDDLNKTVSGLVKDGSLTQEQAQSVYSEVYNMQAAELQTKGTIIMSDNVEEAADLLSQRQNLKAKREGLEGPLKEDIDKRIQDTDEQIKALQVRDKAEYEKVKAEEAPASEVEVTIKVPYDEYGDVDYEAASEVDAIARKRDLGITSDREIASIARDSEGNIIGGAYTSYDNTTGEYTFDVVVDERFDGKGVGSKLLNEVIEIPFEIEDMNPDAKVVVDVVNPQMQSMLEARGFEVIEKTGPSRVKMSPKLEVQESDVSPEVEAEAEAEAETEDILSALDELKVEVEAEQKGSLMDNIDKKVRIDGKDGVIKIDDENENTIVVETDDGQIIELGRKDEIGDNTLGSENISIIPSESEEFLSELDDMKVSEEESSKPDDVVTIDGVDVKVIGRRKDKKGKAVVRVKEVESGLERRIIGEQAEVILKDEALRKEKKPEKLKLTVEGKEKPRTKRKKKSEKKAKEEFDNKTLEELESMEKQLEEDTKAFEEMALEEAAAKATNQDIVQVGDNIYQVTKKKDNSYTVSQMRADGKLVPSKDKKVRGKVIGAFKSKKSNKERKAINDAEKLINEFKDEGKDRILDFLDKAISSTSSNGRAFDATIGIPMFAVNSSLKIVRASYKAGKTIVEAIQDSLKQLKKQGYTPNEAKYKKYVVDALSKDTTPKEKSAVEELRKGKMTTTKPVKIYKGIGGKKDIRGQRINAHKGVKGIFSAVDKKLAEEYGREEGVAEIDLPAGVTVEVVEVDTKGLDPKQYRAAEVKAINESDAQVVKLITIEGKVKGLLRNGDGKQQQYIIKDFDLVPELKAQKPTTPKQQLSESESNKVSKSVEDKTVKGEKVPTLLNFKVKDKVEFLSFEGEINQKNVKEIAPQSYNTTASKLSTYNTFAIDRKAMLMESIEGASKKDINKKLNENKIIIDKAILKAKKNIDKIKGKKKLTIKEKKLEINQQKEIIDTLRGIKKFKDLVAQFESVMSIKDKVLSDSLYNSMFYKLGPNLSKLNTKELLKKSDNIYSKAKEIVKSNLLSVYNSVSPSIRKISKLWYDGANLIAQDMSSKYDITTEQTAAIIATQSPQMPWFDNLHLADVIMDTLRNRSEALFTQEMFDYYVLKSKDYPNQIKYIPTLKKQVGKKLNELSNYDAGIFIRVDYDLNISRKAPIRIPTGTAVKESQKGDSSFSGYPVIEKGVAVFRDGSINNISNQLGRANKVRNFYVNIVNPSDRRAVTIDTHAMAIALFKPLASNDIEVNFGPSSFAFYADSYRELAEELGIEARALQSITWEAARAIFPAAKKAQAGYKDSISEIWDNFSSKKETLEKIQKQIYNQAKDPNITEWSDYINELKNEKTRENVSGRIIRFDGAKTSDKLGDVSKPDSRVSKSTRRPVSDDKTSTKIKTETKQQVDDIVSDLDTILDQGNIKGALDFLDGIKLDPNTMNSSIPFATQIWNTFIESIKLSIKAGNSVQKAFEIAARKLMDSDSSIDKNDMRKAANFFSKSTKKEINVDFLEDAVVEDAVVEDEVVEDEVVEDEVVEPTPKKQKTKEKSLEKRVLKSKGTPRSVKQKIEALGIDYEVESQDLAIEDADKIISEIGLDEAYQAAQDNIITGSRQTVIEFRKQEDLTKKLADAISEGNQVLAEEIEVILTAIYEKHSTRFRERGRQLSILNRMYNISSIQFEVASSKKEWKKRFGEEMPVDVQKRMERLEKKIKEQADKLEKLEEERGKKEEQQAVKNIKEVVERKEKKPRVSKRKKVEGILNKLNALEKKLLSQSYSDPTLVVSTIVTGIKAIKVSVKTYAATVDAIQDSKIKEIISDGINDIKKKLKSIGEKLSNEAELRQDIEDLFTDAPDDVDIDQKDIKIPKGLLYDLVKGGKDNINDLTNAVKDAIKDDYPNATKREVRDAITRYGLQVNKPKDSIKKILSSLKIDGSLLSKLEDLLDGKRPKKRKGGTDYTEDQLKKIKEIRRRLKTLPIEDSADVDGYYKSALSSYKTRLQNRIDELNKAVKENKLIENENVSLELDNEAKRLKEELEVAKKEYSENFKDSDEVHQTKIKSVEKAKEARLRRLEEAKEDLIQDREERKKDKKKPIESDKITQLDKQIEQARMEYHQILEDIGIAESKRVAKALNYIDKRKQYYRDKIKNKDFSKRKPNPFTSDPQIAKAKQELLKEKNAYMEEFSKFERKNRSLASKTIEGALDILNVPKGLLATADLSAPGRQGVFLGASNPKQYKNAFIQMHKSFASSVSYENFMASIENSEYFNLMMEAGLELTDTSGKVNKTEEQFISNLVKTKIKVKGKNINIIGMPVDASERGYVTFLNSLRSEVFIKGVKVAEDMGITPATDPKFYQDLAKMVNYATGRGALTENTNFDKALNLFFFSPRMITGMVGLTAMMLNPKTTKYVRYQALKGVGTFIMYQAIMKGLFAAIIGSMSALGGDDDEEVDILNLELTDTDFGKVRYGDTTYDPTGGWSVLLRTAGRLGYGTKSVDGKDIPLDEGYMKSRFDDILRVLKNKLSPTARQAFNYIDNQHPTDFTKDVEDATVFDYVQALAMPLSNAGLMEDVNRISEGEKGATEAKATLNFLMNFYGVGTMTYDRNQFKKEKPKRKGKPMTLKQAKMFMSPGDYKQFEAMMKEMNAMKTEIRNIKKEAMK